MEYSDSICSAVVILTPSSDEDVVLIAVTVSSDRSEETRYSVDCLLSLLDLYILIKRERERGVKERVCTSLSEAVHLEVPYLEYRDVVVVKLGDWRDARELTGGGGNVEQWDIAIRWDLRWDRVHVRCSTHCLSFIVNVGSSRRGIHHKVRLDKENLNVDVSGNQSFDVETPHEFP